MHKQLQSEVTTLRQEVAAARTAANNAADEVSRLRSRIEAAEREESDVVSQVCIDFN